MSENLRTVSSCWWRVAGAASVRRLKEKMVCGWVRSFRKAGISVVFYNKEAPAHFRHLLLIVLTYDVILTTREPVIDESDFR